MNVNSIANSFVGSRAHQPPVGVEAPPSDGFEAPQMSVGVGAADPFVTQLTKVNDDFIKLIGALSGEVTDMTALIAELNAAGVGMMAGNTPWAGEQAWRNKLNAFRDSRLPTDVQNATTSQGDTAALIQGQVANTNVLQSHIETLNAQIDAGNSHMISIFSAAGVAPGTDPTTATATVVAKLRALQAPAPPPPAPAPLAMGAQKPLIPIGTIIAGLAALAVVGGGFWWWYSTQQQKKKKAGPVVGAGEQPASKRYPMTAQPVAPQLPGARALMPRSNPRALPARTSGRRRTRI